MTSNKRDISARTTPIGVFRRGAYTVTSDHTGVHFQTLYPPACSGRLVETENYRFEMGEVFFGPEGRCVVALEFAMGEPDEPTFVELVSHFDAELAGWEHWPCDIPRL